MSLLYLLAVQAIFNFAVRPQGICSVEFVTHFVHINLKLRGMVSKSVPHINYEFGLSGLASPSANPKTIFSQLSWCSLRL